MMNARILCFVILFALTACADGDGPSLEISNAQSPIAEDSKANFKSRATDSERKSSSSFSLFGDSSESSAAEFKDIEEDEETETLLAVAEKMRAKGDLATASVLYQRAAATHPQSLKALAGLAKLEETRGQPREAIKAYREMLRIDESLAPAYRGLGRNFMLLGLYDKAVQELEKLSKLDDGKPETLNLLAMANLRAGKEKKAIDILKNAAQRYPENLTTQNNLGFAYLMNNDIDQAIHVLEKLVKDVGATAQHRQNLALAYGLAGREDAARKLSLQDLPPAAVENNIRTYRTMRGKKYNTGGKPPVKPKKAAPKKAANVPAIKPVPKTEQAPAPQSAPQDDVIKEILEPTPTP